MKEQYWICIIGPAESDELNKFKGADYPLRIAVEEKFIDMFDNQAKICASGWGIDTEKYELMRKAWSMSTTDLAKKLK